MTIKSDYTAWGEPLRLPTNLIASAHEQTLLVSDMPVATIIYLLLNGYSQSMTDAGTSAAAKSRDAACKAANEQRGKGNAMTAAQAKEFCATPSILAMVESASRDARNKRQLALVEGTMVYGVRGPNGPRKSPLEAFLSACAEADAKAMAARKGKPMPKGDALETLLAGIIAVRRMDYTERFDANATPVEDLDSLFG